MELELLGIPTAGDWVLDHFAATRNVFPDGRWVTFPFPDGFRYYNIHRPGLEAVLRARAGTAGAELPWRRARPRHRVRSRPCRRAR